VSKGAFLKGVRNVTLIWSSSNWPYGIRFQMRNPCVARVVHIGVVWLIAGLVVGYLLVDISSDSNLHRKRVLTTDSFLSNPYRSR